MSVVGRRRAGNSFILLCFCRHWVRFFEIFLLSTITENKVNGEIFLFCTLKKMHSTGAKNIYVFLVLLHLLSVGCHWVMKWGRVLSRRRVRISQPVSVTSSVCSNCAERFPSLVTAVQPSGHVSSCHPPGNRQHHFLTLPVLNNRYQSPKGK